MTSKNYCKNVLILKLQKQLEFQIYEPQVLITQFPKHHYFNIFENLTEQEQLKLRLVSRFFNERVKEYQLNYNFSRISYQNQNFVQSLQDLQEEIWEDNTTEINFYYQIMDHNEKFLSLLSGLDIVVLKSSSITIVMKQIIKILQLLLNLPKVDRRDPGQCQSFQNKIFSSKKVFEQYMQKINIFSNQNIDKINKQLQKISRENFVNKQENIIIYVENLLRLKSLRMSDKLGSYSCINQQLESNHRLLEMYKLVYRNELKDYE